MRKHNHANSPAGKSRFPPARKWARKRKAHPHDDDDDDPTRRTIHFRQFQDGCFTPPLRFITLALNMWICEWTFFWEACSYLIWVCSPVVKSSAICQIQIRKPFRIWNSENTVSLYCSLKILLYFVNLNYTQISYQSTSIFICRL